MIQYELLKKIKEVSENKEIYLFGAGSFGKQIKDEIGRRNISIKGFIDNDQLKWKTSIEGKRVYSLKDLLDFEKKNCFIIVSSTYYETIEQQLNSYGLRKEIDYKVIEPFTVDDSYIQWLTFANAGMLQPGNIEVFDYVIQNLPSEKPMIEIGSFCGLSTNVILYLLEKFNKENILFSSDKWIFEDSGEVNIGSSSMSFKDYREYVKSSFIRNIEFFSGNRMPHTIEEFSDDFFRQWSDKQKVKDVFQKEVTLGGSISFCYIDGNHTYDFAKRDFLNTDEHLEVGGFVFFDDSSDGNTFGLSPLMNEILENESYELITKNPNYLFKKIK